MCVELGNLVEGESVKKLLTNKIQNVIIISVRLFLCIHKKKIYP